MFILSIEGKRGFKRLLNKISLPWVAVKCWDSGSTNETFIGPNVIKMNIALAVIVDE